MASATATRTERRRPSPLTLRILAVNVLALALLVAGLLYLGRYQDRLIEAELEALTTEARIFATALGEGAVERITPENETSGLPLPAGDTGNQQIPDRESYELSPELARQMLRRLVETTATRTRLYGVDGLMVADSRVLTGSPGNIEIRTLPPPTADDGLIAGIESLTSRLVSVMPNRDNLPVYEERFDQPPSQSAGLYSALSGETTAAAWRTAAPDEDGADDLLLTVVVPVQRYKEVLGAVMLSRDGAGIDAAIRSVRIDILKIFALALLVTILLSIYLAGTIARPIRLLAEAADRLRLGHGRHGEIPDFTRRGDEIGELSGVLRDMTAALWTRMDAIERFAADVAHEIKNPLSSLRSAVETIGRVNDPERRARLMTIIADDVQRLDRLISDISNASRLDAELSRAEPEKVDVGAMLATLVEIHSDVLSGHGEARNDDETPATPHLRLELASHELLTVLGLEGRLTQLFQNLIANALSFSPPGGEVLITARREAGQVMITVADDGPGIPPGKEKTIFERFYTERPKSEKFGTHSGLGLSISQQIIQAHNGSLTAANRHSANGKSGGAIFTITMPKV